MCAADHVVRFTRPSPSVFAYCKRSKTGAGEGLGTRLGNMPVVMDLLKRSERLLDILEAVVFSILVEIPSAPVAFVESREWMRSKT